MKKLVSVLLAVILMFGVTVTVFAETTPKDEFDFEDDCIILCVNDDSYVVSLDNFAQYGVIEIDDHLAHIGVYILTLDKHDHQNVLDVIEELNSISDGRYIAEPNYMVYPADPDNPGYGDIPVNYYEDRFVEEYVGTFEGFTPDYYYDELYYHYDENGKRDWVLVYASNMIGLPWEVMRTVADRIFYNASEMCPFDFGYGVYDVENDCFADLTNKILDKYDGLYDAMVELKIGNPLGDADNDRILSVMDATFIQMAEAQLVEYGRFDCLYGYGSIGGFEVKYISDFNLDGERNILDATAIQRKIAKINDEDLGPVDPGEELEFYITKSDDFVHSRNLPDMPEDVTLVAYNNEHEIAQFTTNMYKFDVAGECYTVAIIKNVGQYNALFNEKAPQYDEEFFESKWLVVSLTLCSDLLTEAPITSIAKNGDTLYVCSNPVRVNLELAAPDALQMWLSIVAVDIDELKDIKNIVKVKNDAEYNEELVYSSFNNMYSIDTGWTKVNFQPVYFGAYEYEDYNSSDDTFAVVVKTKEQYDALFNVHNDVFTESFFKNNWLVVSVYQVTEARAEATITRMYLFNDSLMIHIQEDVLEVPDDDGMLLPLAPPYMFFATVSKDSVNNVKNIIWY